VPEKSTFAAHPTGVSPAETIFVCQPSPEAKTGILVRLDRGDDLIGRSRLWPGGATHLSERAGMSPEAWDANP
jgi:hypothetical protein